VRVEHRRTSLFQEGCATVPAVGGALLTVTYAYVEKGVVTQAISGPFDLGRPWGCPGDSLSGTSRLEAVAPKKGHKKSAKRHHKKTIAKKK
jgi:hypothetical protein